MDKENNDITCLHCGKIWDKQLLDRSCSNCFACTGCEAYICPECRYEIVVIPIKQIKKCPTTDISRTKILKNSAGQ